MMEELVLAERNMEDSVENAHLSMVLNDGPGTGEDGSEIKLLVLYL